ncbi:MAG: CRISPR-associated endonuclease Cas1 [Eubacterium sp.]|nr:CRISPR-associated endonuclease Cas1 [Eubacterium sp.]
MAVLYIKEQGAFVQKQDERIIVTKNNNKLLDIPVFKIDNIALIGNVQVSTQALHLLMQNAVDVSYLTYSGKYLGNVAADVSKNIFLRFEQYQYYLDLPKRLDMAKIIVENKISNQKAVIKNHRWTGSEYDWHRDIDSLDKHKKKLPEAKTANEILGIEGICSNIYFGAFGKMLKCDFDFNGRNRRPPKDPVNIILSLAYTFLTKEVCSALDAESFESYLGFLHGIRYGRKSLALDMVEEFRQPVVDRLVILLFNKKIINSFDFEFEEDDVVTLNEEGFKKFCNEYEKWMTGKNSLSGEKSYRGIIRSQINELKKSITKGDEYIPYRWR